MGNTFHHACEYSGVYLSKQLSAAGLSFENAKLENLLLYGKHFWGKLAK